LSVASARNGPSTSTTLVSPDADGRQACQRNRRRPRVACLRRPAVSPWRLLWRFALALEAPFRVFVRSAAVSAKRAVAGEFQVAGPWGQSTSSVMNHERYGGPPWSRSTVVSVSFFRPFFYKLGKVRSSRESAQYFADLKPHHPAHLKGNETQVADGGFAWKKLLLAQATTTNVEVELVAIHGGGHGNPPQPYPAPSRRLLGPSPKEPKRAGSDIGAFFRPDRAATNGQRKIDSAAALTAGRRTIR